MTYDGSSPCPTEMPMVLIYWYVGDRVMVRYGQNRYVSDRIYWYVGDRVMVRYRWS